MKSFKFFAIALMLLLGCNFILSAQGNGQPKRMMMPEGTYKWASGQTSTTIPFILYRSLIAISVEINGVNANLILDTGMPMMGGILNGSTIADKLNLTYSGEAMIGGAGGKGANAKIAGGANFKIGDLEFSNQTLIVLPDSPNLKYFETNGIIGGEIFNRFIVDVDYELQTITLTEPSVYTVKKDFEELQLTFENKYPFISSTATMESGKTIPLNLVLDLGAGHAVSFNIGSQNDIVLPQKNISVSVGRGVDSEIFGFVGRINNFKLGTFEFNNVLASFNEKRRMPLEKEGNLGCGILRRFHCIIDFPGKRMFIKPNKFYNDPFEFNMAGIQTSKSEGIVTIDRVIPNSAGSEAGLMAGDVIQKINNVDISRIDRNELFKLFEKENQVLALTIQRDGVIKSISVKLRRVI